MKGGGKYSCPFCLVNTHTNVQWRADWEVMRTFSEDWKLIPNQKGKEHWESLVKLIREEYVRLVAQEKGQGQGQGQGQERRRGRGAEGERIEDQGPPPAPTAKKPKELNGIIQLICFFQISGFFICFHARKEVRSQSSGFATDPAHTCID